MKILCSLLTLIAFCSSAYSSEPDIPVPFTLEWGLGGQRLLVDNGQLGELDPKSLALVFQLSKPGMFHEFPKGTKVITIYSYPEFGVQRIEWHSRRSSWQEFLKMDAMVMDKYGPGDPIGDSTFTKCTFNEVEGYCTKTPRVDEKTGQVLPIPVTIFARFYASGTVFHRWDDYKEIQNISYFGPQFLDMQ